MLTGKKQLSNIVDDPEWRKLCSH